MRRLDGDCVGWQAQKTDSEGCFYTVDDEVCCLLT